MSEHPSGRGGTEAPSDALTSGGGGDQYTDVPDPRGPVEVAGSTEPVLAAVEHRHLVHLPDGALFDVLLGSESSQPRREATGTSRSSPPWTRSATSAPAGR
jgi:hypothetical protein